MSKKIYSPERYQEFEACLDLFLQQKDSEETIVVPRSFVSRNKQGRISNFSILISGIYENAIFSCWEGADPEIENSKKELVEALKGYALSQKRGVLALTREGKDEEILNYGFQSANDGIPEVFAKGDPTKFLLYSKKL